MNPPTDTEPRLIRGPEPSNAGFVPSSTAEPIRTAAVVDGTPKEEHKFENLVNGQLRSIWDSLLSEDEGDSGLEFGNSAPIIAWVREALPVPGFYVAAKWREDNGSTLRDSASAPSPAELRARVEGLQGPYERVLLGLLSRLQGLRGDTAGLRDFFRTTFAATLQRFEPGGDAPSTAEQQCDLILSAALQGVRMKYTRNMLRMTAAMHTLLLAEPPAARRAGYYATRASLGDILGREPTQESLKVSIYYYDEVARELWRMANGQEEKRLTDEEICKRVHIVINNMAGRFVSLQQDGGVEHLKPPLALLMTIAIACAQDSSDSDLPENAGEFWIRAMDQALESRPREPGTGALGNHVTRAAGMLDNMMKISTAWNDGLHEIQSGLPEPTPASMRALMDCMASDIRLRSYKRRRNVPSALFNAGVNLLRDKRSGKGESRPEEAILARIMLNGLGVLMAFEGTAFDVAPDQPLSQMPPEAQAQMESISLVVYDGLDCTVNMLGALTELGERGRHEIEVRAVAGAVRGLLDRVKHQKTEEESHRLNASFRELNVASIPGTGPGTLTPAVRTLLRSIYKSLRLRGFAPEAKKSGTPALLPKKGSKAAKKSAAADGEGATMEDLWPEEGDAFKTGLGSLLQQILSVAFGVDKIRAGLANIGRLLRAMLDTEALHYFRDKFPGELGIIVSAGFKDIERAKIEQGARMDQAPRLSDELRGNSLDWVEALPPGTESPLL